MLLCQYFHFIFIYFNFFLTVLLTTYNYLQLQKKNIFLQCKKSFTYNILQGSAHKLKVRERVENGHVNLHLVQKTLANIISGLKVKHRLWPFKATFEKHNGRAEHALQTCLLIIPQSEPLMLLTAHHVQHLKLKAHELLMA